jgi:hypothetical protein
LIESASYREFWTAYDDDLYADLVADCAGFEETMRDAIALQISMIAREVKKDFVQGSLNVNDDNLTSLLQRYGWTVEGDMIKIPINKENEAKTMVFRESVAFNRTSHIYAELHTAADYLQSFRVSSVVASSRPLNFMHCDDRDVMYIDCRQSKSSCGVAAWWGQNRGVKGSFWFLRALRNMGKRCLSNDSGIKKGLQYYSLKKLLWSFGVIHWTGKGRGIQKYYQAFSRIILLACG